MTNGQIRDLCIALLHADSEEEAIGLLKEAGYWDKPELWRHYGDLENNWGTGGNQQSLAEAALAEKLVNSVDARLINECLVRNIDPKSKQAPQSIPEAVATFFEETGKETDQRIDRELDRRAYPQRRTRHHAHRYRHSADIEPDDFGRWRRAEPAPSP